MKKKRNPQNENRPDDKEETGTQGDFRASEFHKLQGLRSREKPRETKRGALDASPK